MFSIRRDMPWPIVQTSHRVALHCHAPKHGQKASMMVRHSAIGRRYLGKDWLAFMKRCGWQPGNALVVGGFQQRIEVSKRHSWPLYTLATAASPDAPPPDWPPPSEYGLDMAGLMLSFG